MVNFSPKPDSRRCFNRIHQMAPTTQERVTITLGRVSTALFMATLWNRADHCI